MRARRGWSSTARASWARSAAQEWLPASTKPLGRREARAAQAHGPGPLVHQRDERALRVRPRAAPARSAASLPDGSSSPCSSVSTRTRRALGQHADAASRAQFDAPRAVIRDRRARRQAVDHEQRGHHLRQAGDRQDAGRAAAATGPRRCRGRRARPARGWWWKRSAIWSARGGDAQLQRPGARGGRARPGRWRPAASGAPGWPGAGTRTACLAGARAAAPGQRRRARRRRRRWHGGPSRRRRMAQRARRRPRRAARGRAPDSSVSTSGPPATSAWTVRASSAATNTSTTTRSVVRTALSRRDGAGGGRRGRSRA